LLKGNIFGIIPRVEFEWDPKKETLNLAKHGVSFVEALSGALDHETTGQQDDKEGGMEQGAERAKSRSGGATE
jgi:uncharacterized DUF497 family protein